MAGKQINPKLIQALTNKDISTIPASPTFKHLGGTYVKSIVDNLRKTTPYFDKNEVMMTCQHCKQSGKYNVGLVMVGISEDNKPEQQYTGYFRCKHCNAAGEWEEPVELYMLNMSAMLSPEEDNPYVQYGQMQLFDGTIPKYATDGEDHLLSLISNSPDNALLWNKLGNLYYTGARPELAMAAFEKSIALDPNQLESHLSIGKILYQIKDYQHAIKHFHQMMLVAEQYEHLDAHQLREIIAFGICQCFIASTESKNRYLPIPTKEQIMEANRTIDLETPELLEGITLSSEDMTTFYPFAEAFMGKRAEELTGEN